MLKKTKQLITLTILCSFFLMGCNKTDLEKKSKVNYADLPKVSTISWDQKFYIDENHNFDTLPSSIQPNDSIIFTGIINKEGKTPTTEKGFYLTTDATIEVHSLKKYISSSKETFFFTKIPYKDLLPRTRYFVGAYATNSLGTSYAWANSFVTPGGSGSVIFEDKTGTVTDIDGNVYKTVLIYGKEWMAENLRTTKLNDGTPIPNIENDSIWTNINSIARCNYNNSNAIDPQNGILYNWYVASNEKTCPINWHVPSLSEMEELISITKSVFRQNILSPTWDEKSKNEVGFNLLPAGARQINYSKSTFYGKNSQAYLWTSWEDSEKTANVIYLTPDSHPYNVFYSNRQINLKNSGYSIRCVKNESK